MTAPLDAWGTLMAAVGHAAWIVEGEALRVILANGEASSLLGLPVETLVGAHAAELIGTPEDLAFWDEAASGQGDRLTSETTLADARGQLRPVMRRIQRITTPGECRHYLVTVEDRTAVVEQQEAAEQLVADLQATLESTADGILVSDLSGHIRAFNRRFAQIWGIPDHLLSERQDQAVFEWLERSVVDAEAWRRRVQALNKSAVALANERVVLRTGQVLELVSHPQRSHGRLCGRVWSFRDQTELVHAGQRIETLVTTDALTGLFNRRQVTEALDGAIARAKRTSGTLALLIVDLDRFKQINDSLGHEVGDQVLLDAAERLKASLRQGDLVARVGGDQFALLIHEADHRGAEIAARRVLDAISKPCAVDGLQFTLTCSIGLALFPSDGDNADELVRHAETAMHRAKLAGRAGFRFHQPRHDADLRQRMRLDHAMRQALASHRFRLVYQPQVDLHDGRIVGAEALIRWRDPELGEVSPGEFIPAAEDSGFIIAIGDWVLTQAVRQAAMWRTGGLEMPMSINVSALQFQQADFADRVTTVLQEHRLPPRLLELELTESILVHDADEALGRLSALAKAGVKLAIDDFGTGYSSLAYLKRFPIARLKIDRSFVSSVPSSDSDVGIVRAIIQMSRALDMKVIAEGVETEAQRAFLQEAGCDQFQGYLFAPALDALTFVERTRDLAAAPRRRFTLVANR